MAVAGGARCMLLILVLYWMFTGHSVSGLVKFVGEEADRIMNKTSVSLVSYLIMLIVNYKQLLQGNLMN